MWGILIGCLMLIFVVVFISESELYRNHKKNSRGVVNHDSSMREFCYKVDKSEKEIWESLRRNDVYTSIKYRIHKTNNIITFYSELPDGYRDISYTIHTFKCDHFTLLKVIQLDHLLSRNQYALLQNEFWKQKLGATPIPYIRRFE